MKVGGGNFVYENLPIGIVDFDEKTMTKLGRIAVAL